MLVRIGDVSAWPRGSRSKSWLTATCEPRSLRHVPTRARSTRTGMCLMPLMKFDRRRGSGPVTSRSASRGSPLHWPTLNVFREIRVPLLRHSRPGSSPDGRPARRGGSPEPQVPPGL